VGDRAFEVPAALARPLDHRIEPAGAGREGEVDVGADPEGNRLKLWDYLDGHRDIPG
jgi:hypothetical protein